MFGCFVTTPRIPFAPVSAHTRHAHARSRRRALRLHIIIPHGYSSSNLRAMFATGLPYTLLSSFSFSLSFSSFPSSRPRSSHRLALPFPPLLSASPLLRFHHFAVSNYSPSPLWGLHSPGTRFWHVGRWSFMESYYAIRGSLSAEGKLSKSRNIENVNRRATEIS